MRIWLKGTEQFLKKWYCENSRLVVVAVLTPPSPFTSWAFPPRSWCSPPRRGLKGSPHPQCAHFRTSTAQVPSSALFPPAAGMKHGQPQVRTVSPGDSHPCVPTPGELRVPWLSSHLKWTHVIECTWLSARCGQRQELQHPARIRIQIRNLVLTRTFFSFKNTKFELKIFRE